MPIRPFTSADLGSVIAIEKACTDFPWSDGQFRSSLAAEDICRALEEDGKVIGFSIFSLVLDEATLLNIAVLPACQGRGYGRKLLQHGLREVTDRGAIRCFLEVREFNLTAQSLYRSMGFETVGKRKAYYPAHGGREDGLVMCRQLPLTSLVQG